MRSSMNKHKPSMLAGQKFSDRNQRIYDFLYQHPVGVLSTVTPNGDPNGVVIYFVIDENFNVSFLTRSGTRKYDNLKHYPHTMLTVFEPKSQTTVQVTGKAKELTAAYDINRIAGLTHAASLKTSGPDLLPITKLEEEGAYVAFEIEPTQIRMAVYSRPDPGDYDSIFESIESFDFEKNA